MESSGLVGFCLTSTCLCQTLSLAVVSGTDEKHSIALFVLPDVSKSSTPHVFDNKKAQNLFICCMVSCYEVRLAIVAKTEGSNCLFLWSYWMFLWTLHRWHEVLSPERDWVPCWSFCVQIRWELGLLTISRQTLTSLTMFVGFSPWGVSYAAFPLWFGIIYDLSSGRKRAISPHSTPSVHVMSPGWQQHHKFGIHLQQGKTHQNVKASAWRHKSEEWRKGAGLSAWEGITWEKPRDIDWGTSGTKRMVSGL